MKLEELLERDGALGTQQSVWIKTDGYEFKVPAPDGDPSGAYFTTDEQDAIMVAKEMYGDEIRIKMREVPVLEGATKK